MNIETYNFYKLIEEREEAIKNCIDLEILSLRTVTVLVGCKAVDKKAAKKYVDAAATVLHLEEKEVEFLLEAKELCKQEKIFKAYFKVLKSLYYGWGVNFGDRLVKRSIKKLYKTRTAK